MIAVHSFEENIKVFNKMFNKLNPDHYDRFTYIMAEVVVEKVKKEFGDNPSRLRDVEKWCRERLYRRQN